MSLPPRFGVALDPGVRRIDSGRVLVGGAPLRILRLTAAGASVIDALITGEQVGPGAARQGLARRLLDAGMAHPRPPGGEPTPTVTVVIPVRDDAAGLATTLRSLGPLDAVIVDDGSRVALTGASIRHRRPRGPAAARNAGAATVTTDLVAFVDAGCEPAPGWLASLLPHFQDPSVAAVAPRVPARPAPGLPRWLATYERVRSPLDRGHREATVRPRSPVPYVPTAALVVRRSALEAVGGFDEGMTMGEDVDLVWRLVGAGWTVRYEPAALVTHPTRSSARAWARQRFDYGTSAAGLRRRHGTAVAPVAVSAWSALSWGLAVLGLPAAGGAVAAGTTALLAPRLRGLEHPWLEAGRLAGRGHLFAGRQLADAVRRAWWPIALPLAIGWRRARPAVVAAFAVAPIVEWMTERPPLDPARWLMARLVDDLAYATGVWAGCLRARSAAALAPDLASWPGRQPAISSPTMDTKDTISPG
jgi:mycofactocin glycosyltransferase